MLLSFLEFTAVVLLIVGFIHEDKFIAFEKRLAESYREYRAQKKNKTRRTAP
jgi:hypothetical protein